MKILIVNSRYFLSSGPDRYMFKLMDVLTRKGHQPIPFSIKNSRNLKTRFERYFARPVGGVDAVYFKDYKRSLSSDIDVLKRLFYSQEVKDNLAKLIKDEKPEVAYVLHHYNKLSPSVLDACYEAGIPVVLRISDFFLVCPESHLFRNGGNCEECLTGSLMNAVRYRCVKGSFSMSLAKATALSYHRMSGVYGKVSKVVVPSKFTMSKISSVFSNSSMVHLPTFVEPKKLRIKKGDYFLIVGRLEPQKGVLNAIQAVKGTHHKLIVAGSSSTGHDVVLREYVKSNHMDNVEFLGEVQGKSLDELYRSCAAVIIPALWYENLPNVALEALSYAKPLIVSDIGSLREIVSDQENGLLFKAGDSQDLKSKLDRFVSPDTNYAMMCKNAYKCAQTTYSEAAHYKSLMAVFDSVRNKQ